MIIGCISPYLHALGGGERYMMTIASHLSRTHTVQIFWDDSSILEKIEKRLGIDMSRITVKPNIWTTGTLLMRLKASLAYDCLIILSDGSVPLSLAKKNILHFQRPFHDVGGGSVVNQIKLMRYQNILVNSAFTKEWIDREFHINSTILYPPVTSYIFDQKKKKHLILSVGRFSNEKKTNKKQLALVSAFRKLHNTINKSIVDYSLVLAGGVLPEDISYVEEVKQSAQGLPVHIQTNISQEEIAQLYEQADVYWHAAGYGEDENLNPEGFEHFGISTVEAMSAGAVPIVFNGGGQKEIITHNKNGLLWNTEDELIRFTLDMMTHKQKYQEFQKYAIQRARVYSVENFKTKIDDFIRTI